MQRGKWSDDRSEICRNVVPSVGVEPSVGGFLSPRINLYDVLLFEPQLLKVSSS